MILENKHFLSDKKVKFVFLIRDPKAVIASYYKMLPTFEDFCVDFRGLHEIFQEVWKCQGIKPAVIDAEDLSQHPKETLLYLCEYLGIPFTEKMLSWNKGMIDMWKCYSKWHLDVANSCGFNKHRRPEKDSFSILKQDDQPRLIKLYENNLPFYKALYSHRVLKFTSEES
jgi:hypothetical protein